MSRAFLPVAAQLEVFKRGVVDLIEERELAQRLEHGRASGTPLRVKFGMDPSSPDLHLGHAVQLRKLRDVQELGHTVVLIVGDATALVGDPTGRNELRPELSRDQIESNLATYTEQAAKVLDLARAEVRRNSEWFDALRFEDLLKLAARVTVAQMMERNDFQKRVAEGRAVHLHELLYPLMQGWDSVVVRADLELGGTDQLFNLLRGRDLQQKEGQPGQVCFTMPLINGLDGRKMSKSYSNAIGLTDAPGDVFGKVMSIDDAAMGPWFTLLTRLPEAEVGALLAGHPRAAKARLAEELTAFLHGPDAARTARAAFDRQFKDRELPDDIPEWDWPEHMGSEVLPLSILIRELKLAPSSSEARRKIQEGAVKVDRERITDPNYAVSRPTTALLIQLGHRRFARVRPGRS